MTALAVCLRADARARRARLLAGLVAACHERLATHYEVDGASLVLVAPPPRPLVPPEVWAACQAQIAALHTREARA
jgi:hypothetical protein